MADQAWGTNLVSGDGTALIQGVLIKRLEFSAGPSGGEIGQAHGIAAGFEVIRAWVVHTTAGGDINTLGGGFDANPLVHVDATSLQWNDSGNLSGDTGVGYIEYLP